MITEDVKAWHSKLCDMRTEDIVTLMEQENIKATPGDNMSCAISQLVKEKTGVQVVTGFGGLLGTNDEGNPDFTNEALMHSPSVRRFISEFDKSMYPQLEK